MNETLQLSRRRRSQIGHYLSLDHMIDTAFSLVAEDENNLSILLDFMLARTPLEDLRLSKDGLEPTVLRNRIGCNISDTNLDMWIKTGTSYRGSPVFGSAIEAMSNCVGGLRIAASLIRNQLVHDFFRLALEDVRIANAEWLLKVLEGSQDEPAVAAEIIYDFIRAIRDAGIERSILIAFFEGFSVEVGARDGKGFRAKWNSSPMLQALVKANNEALARFHEKFIRWYLKSKLLSTDESICKWQEQYDQHFQMLINLQSGMFSLDAGYKYGRP